MTGRRIAIFAAVLLSALGAGYVAWQRFARPIVLPLPVSPASAEPEVRPADFAGSAQCADCHATQFAAWKGSTHGRAGGAPGPATVIAPFQGSVIRFANAVVTPRVRAGVYEFSVARHGDPELVFRVDGVIGGGHLSGGGTQGFVTRFDDGTARFLPFEWSRQGRTWFCNTNSRSGRGWAPIVAAMRLEECGDWPPVRVLGDVPRFANCQSCHASQAIVAIDTAAHRYRTTYTSLDINCESCHGPAARHVALARQGALGGAADVALPALATLSKEASVGVCYRCHSVKDQLRAGYVSGAPLSRFYSLKFPQLGDRPLTDDGRVRTFAYQEGHSYSDCYLNGGMTCVSCHDPHTQGYRDAQGTSIPGRYDDRQCTSCHASKADDPPAHTRHPASVRCVACHMPTRQEPETRPANAAFAREAVVPYGRADHTISIPRPGLDSAIGFRSACTACHATMSVTRQESAIREWWGTIKPMHPAVAAQLRADGQDVERAAPLLLGDLAQDSAAFHADARFAGASRFLDAFVTADVTLPSSVQSRLRHLASSSDVDVRAAALASLHLAAGSDRGVRRALAQALRQAAPDDADLRSRWALALAYMGDRFAAQTNLTGAMVAFERSLEVQPANARAALSLANVRRDAGDLTGAIAAYQRSIALDSRSPLAWVNLGIALGAAGDTIGAERALSQAANLDAGEPLAWFNLANIAFVRGDLDRASAMYRRVVRLDPSLAPAHFQLARLSLMKKDEVAALASLRRGLAFDSSDVSARQMADLLAKRLESRTMPER